MIEIGGVDMTDVEARQAKRMLDQDRQRGYTDEQLIEHLGSVLRSDEDPKDWARQIIADLDEKVKDE